MRVLIDAYNPVLAGHNTAQIIRTAQPYLCEQFHAKDGINGQRGNARLGQGDGHFAETVATMKSLNIGGKWILENMYDEDAVARARDDIAIIRSYYA